MRRNRKTYYGSASDAENEDRPTGNLFNPCRRVGLTRNRRQMKESTDANQRSRDDDNVRETRLKTKMRENEIMVRAYQHCLDSCVQVDLCQLDLKKLQAQKKIDEPEPTEEPSSPSIESTSPSIESTSADNIPTEESSSPSIEPISPSIEARSPSIELASPSIEHASPSIEHASPSIEPTSPSMEPASPSIESASVDPTSIEPTTIMESTNSQYHPSSQYNIIEPTTTISRLGDIILEPISPASSSDEIHVSEPPQIDSSIIEQLLNTQEHNIIFDDFPHMPHNNQIMDPYSPISATDTVSPIHTAESIIGLVEAIVDHCTPVGSRCDSETPPDTDSPTDTVNTNQISDSNSNESDDEIPDDTSTSTSDQQMPEEYNIPTTNTSDLTPSDRIDYYNTTELFKHKMPAYTTSSLLNNQVMDYSTSSISSYQRLPEYNTPTVSYPQISNYNTDPSSSQRIADYNTTYAINQQIAEYNHAYSTNLRTLDFHPITQISNNNTSSSYNQGSSSSPQTISGYNTSSHQRIPTNNTSTYNEHISFRNQRILDYIAKKSTKSRESDDNNSVPVSKPTTSNYNIANTANYPVPQYNPSSCSPNQRKPDYSTSTPVSNYKPTTDDYNNPANSSQQRIVYPNPAVLSNQQQVSAYNAPAYSSIPRISDNTPTNLYNPRISDQNASAFSTVRRTPNYNTSAYTSSREISDNSIATNLSNQHITNYNTYPSNQQMSHYNNATDLSNQHISHYNTAYSSNQPVLDNNFYNQQYNTDNSLIPRISTNNIPTNLSNQRITDYNTAYSSNQQIPTYNSPVYSSNQQITDYNTAYSTNQQILPTNLSNQQIFPTNLSNQQILSTNLSNQRILDYNTSGYTSNQQMPDNNTSMNLSNQQISDYSTAYSSNQQMTDYNTCLYSSNQQILTNNPGANLSNQQLSEYNSSIPRISDDNTPTNMSYQRCADAAYSTNQQISDLNHSRNENQQDSTSAISKRISDSNSPSTSFVSSDKSTVPRKQRVQKYVYTKQFTQTYSDCSMSSQMNQTDEQIQNYLNLSVSSNNDDILSALNAPLEYNITRSINVEIETIEDDSDDEDDSNEMNFPDVIQLAAGPRPNTDSPHLSIHLEMDKLTVNDQLYEFAQPNQMVISEENDSVMASFISTQHIPIDKLLESINRNKSRNSNHTSTTSNENDAPNQTVPVAELEQSQQKSYTPEPPQRNESNSEDNSDESDREDDDDDSGPKNQESRPPIEEAPRLQEVVETDAVNEVPELETNDSDTESEPETNTVQPEKNKFIPEIEVPVNEDEVPVNEDEVPGPVTNESDDTDPEESPAPEKNSSEIETEVVRVPEITKNTSHTVSVPDDTPVEVPVPEEHESDSSEPEIIPTPSVKPRRRTSTRKQSVIFNESQDINYYTESDDEVLAVKRQRARRGRPSRKSILKKPPDTPQPGVSGLRKTTKSKRTHRRRNMYNLLKKSEHVRLRGNTSYTIMHYGNVTSYIKSRDNDYTTRETENNATANQQQQAAAVATTTETSDDEPVFVNVNKSMIQERNDYIPTKEYIPEVFDECYLLETELFYGNVPKTPESIPPSKGKTKLIRQKEPPKQNTIKEKENATASVPEGTIPFSDDQAMLFIDLFIDANSGNDDRARMVQNSNHESQLSDASNKQAEASVQPVCGTSKMSDINEATEIAVLNGRIKAVQYQLKAQQEKLDRLKRVREYKKNHNLQDLHDVTTDIKRGCREALIDLLQILKEHADCNFDMGTLLHNMKIPNELVGYHEEEDCFD